MGKRILAVDAETDGLYGDPFAIGAVVLDESGREVDRFGGLAGANEVGDVWVRANVLPHLGDLPSFSSRFELRETFWQFWMKHRGECLCVADVAVPVEAGLFRLCVAVDASRTFLGPFPLHDVATLLLALGTDPLTDRAELLSGWGVTWTGVRHNPVDDALAGALVFWHGLQKTRAL